MTTGGTSQTKMLAAEPLRAQMGLDELPETCPDPPPRVVASALAARLLRCSPLFAVIRPGDGCVLHSNDNFRTFAGVGGPVEGRSIDDLFDSAGERDALRTALDRAVAEGEPAVRRSVSDDDAHDVAWSVEAAPVAGEEGTDAVVVHGFVGGGTADFSRGPFGDAVLDEGVSAEDLIGSTFEAIDDAIFVVAVPERVVAACNSAATDMFGYPREEIVGASTEVLHVDSERARRFGELIAEPLEETGSFRGDFTMQRADDTTFPTEHVVSYIEPEDGADPTHVVSVVRDMTERAEAERRLRESEEKFSKAFHLNPLALAILSVDEAEFLEVNAGFTRLTGYDPAEVVGRRDSESGLWVRESDRLEVARRVVDEGSIREYETRLRRSDGELRDVLVSVERTDFGGRARLLVALRDVTPRREYERKLERRAVKDPLTGLPNRTLLRDRLEHAVEQSRDECTEVAVAVVDLVRFRDVNQTLGHAAGDELLRECARRLSASVDDAVTVARIGADDFVVLFEKVGGVGAVEERCRRLMSSVTEPCRLAGTVVHPEVSVGVATLGAGASDADSLLRYAETALSKAKSSEGTAVSTFEPDSDASSADRLHRENELREAVSNREFTVRYQPIVEIESGAVLGVEALVRWDHPERGIVSPGQFLDLAEQ
ncbi:MAG: diguanylate cyclase domain-containing protein, partial [Bradymonadaceae bacterium]